METILVGIDTKNNAHIQGGKKEYKKEDVELICTSLYQATEQRARKRLNRMFWLMAITYIVALVILVVTLR